MMPYLKMVLVPWLLVAPPAAYDRDAWGGWVDADGDCQDTRQEVLIRDAYLVALDAAGCRVVWGLWLDPYTWDVHTDPGDIDVDHRVAVFEAHASGGAAWDEGERVAFTNDMSNLVAVGARVNRSKGARGPDAWLPPVNACRFAVRWLNTKYDYGLQMTTAEWQATVDACS